MTRSRLVLVTVTLALAMTGAVEAATDLFGDPLPESAVQRLGSLRLRYGGIGDLAYLPDGRAGQRRARDGEQGGYSHGGLLGGGDQAWIRPGRAA